jgi:hypothetical protein
MRFRLIPLQPVVIPAPQKRASPDLRTGWKANVKRPAEPAKEQRFAQALESGQS